MLVPARLPVRVFPSIWVAGGENSAETFLADRLAAHLAQDARRQIRRVQLGELEPARAAGTISPTTAVLLLHVSIHDSVRRYWNNVPMQYCGPMGCGPSYQTFLMTAIEVTLHADVTVYEGPSARVLMQDRFESSSLGDDLQNQQAALLEEMAIALERAVDVLRIHPRFELYRVSMPEVKMALAAIERGDWREGRAQLESAARNLGGQKPALQARVWFDLGLARWASPGPEGLTEQAYQDARRAFEWAQRLQPKPLHQRAIAELGRAREGFATLQEQREVAKHNFSLVQEQAPAEQPVPAPDPPTASPPPAP
jgi:hypothetical protein